MGCKNLNTKPEPREEIMCPVCGAKFNKNLSEKASTPSGDTVIVIRTIPKLDDIAGNIDLKIANLIHFTVGGSLRKLDATYRYYIISTFSHNLLHSLKPALRHFIEKARWMRDYELNQSQKLGGIAGAIALDASVRISRTLAEVYDCIDKLKEEKIW